MQRSTSLGNGCPDRSRHEDTRSPRLPDILHAAAAFASKIRQKMQEKLPFHDRFESGNLPARLLSTPIAPTTIITMPAGSGTAARSPRPPPPPTKLAKYTASAWMSEL